jgi:meso-butanediol dehydrogenase / (S,S)-butanediol dehydrogenase / diacetyl reductase
MKLKGKVAVVTGGGRGIGKGIALALAREGADVAVADINCSNAEEVVKEVKALGVRAIPIEVDVTRGKDVEMMYKRTVQELGRVDISVHNAGVISISPVVNLEESQWDHVMDVNAKGTFLCCKAVIPYMLEQGEGRIINVASIAGKDGYGTLAHYCASKFAVVGFTNALAKELAKNHITVNAICPGIVHTDMWDKLAEMWKAPGETWDDSWARHQQSLIPQGEAQTAEDMGDLAVYFATAPHVTGQSVNVDGGTTMH